MQVLQNTSLRTCLKTDRLPPRMELYARSGVKPLIVQRRENTSGIVYLGLNKLSTPFVNNLFSKTENTGQRVLRSEIKGDVVVPRMRLKVLEGNIRFRGPTCYNKVDTDIRSAKTFKTFKKRLKRSTTFNG